MNDAQDARAELPSKYIGWCVLAAAITQLPILVVAISALGTLRSLSQVLLLLTGPTTICLIISAIGLILGRFFGYYFLYVATFFGGIGGLKVSFIPFIQSLLKLGPHTGDVILLLNLLIVGYVIWEHYTRLYELDLPEQSRSRIFLIILVSLGLASIAVGRSLEAHLKGAVGTAQQIPIIGDLLGPFPAEGPLQFVGVHTKLGNGVMLIVSGQCSSNAVADLARRHSWTRMTNAAAHAKFLPMAKSWRLATNTFPVAFAPDDLYYIGRLSEARRVSVQLCYRLADRRFTAQVMGQRD